MAVNSPCFTTKSITTTAVKNDNTLFLMQGKLVQYGQRNNRGSKSKHMTFTQLRSNVSE